MKRVVINIDEMRIIDFFDVSETKEKIKELKAQGWYNPSVDNDGDIIVMKNIENDLIAKYQIVFEPKRISLFCPKRVYERIKTILNLEHSLENLYCSFNDGSCLVEAVFDDYITKEDFFSPDMVIALSLD